MKRNINKIIVAFLIIYIVLSMFSNVFASELKTALNTIENASETKYLENNQGFIKKTIVDSNPDTGEVTIELNLSNISKDIEKKGETEIFLVIDNSPSMDFVTSNGKTRKEIVIEASKKLVTSIFLNATKVKIGIVDFHGKNGWIGTAGLENANLTQKLTNDNETVISKLEQLNKSKTVGGTNIDAGLQKANANFSKNCKNKVIILLTDGIPNADVEGNSSGNDVTTNEARVIHENTKESLIKISESGVNIISMMTGMSVSDGNTDKNGNDFGEQNIEEALKALERIFGTVDNPTVGKYYLVKTANVENVIKNDILNNVMEIVQNPINTIKVVDYFPKDITENFEFSYVGNPSIGTASETIDEQTKTITWDIDTLKGDAVATLRYKLKIKDMKNQELLNKTIVTNEKVVLTYKDIESKDYMVTLSSSPRIQLVELKNDEKDPTIANGKIPQAGQNITIVLMIATTLVVGIIMYKKYQKYKGI